LAGVLSLRASDTNLEDQVRSLREQNAALQQQVQKQGDQLDTLSQKIKALETTGTGHDSTAAENSTEPKTGGSHFGPVSISGEGGVSFFKTGPQGFAPESQFRVDEARLFIESPIWKETYFYGELDLATWENDNLNAQLGELYLDFQDVSQLWGRDNQLNFRAGRMYIPFGEEYLYRYDIDNVLISRSLPDLWGVDPGVEFYGSLGKFNYVLAVQNGSGANGVQDFNGDKSVAGRISYDPNGWLHFSLSGMRTGDLNAQQDVISALWFGNGFFRSLGSPATTLFHVELAEGDVSANWSGGFVRAFGGYARYSDNDPTADNARNVFYYSVEATQDLTQKFYTAARFSQIIAADKGFPIVGYGNFNTYFFNVLSTDLWRLSLDLGYRFSKQLVIKVEYSFERGAELGGVPRDQENFVGTEAAFQF
jgi:hypothetical protein